MQSVCKHVAVFVIRSDLVQRKCVECVTSGGAVRYIQTNKQRRVVSQNAPFLRVLAHVLYAENLPAAFHSTEARQYAVRTHKTFNGRSVTTLHPGRKTQS